MRFVPRALLAGGLGFTVSLVVAACGGGSGLLSSDQASTISSQLDQISSALQSGDCRTVSSATVNLSTEVANLPASVSPTLRSNLDQGISTVGQLANRQCKPSQAATTPTTSSSTSSSTTSTTPTTSTSQTASTSTSTTTTTLSTTTTSATTPAGPGTTSTGTGGAGLGGGNGNGNKNSGGTSPGTGSGG